MRIRHLPLATALIGLLFAPAVVRGQTTLTQVKANAGNVTPGDAAGFPVTITRPGAYHLTGNLVVPDEHTNAIEVLSSHVTIDLNGFSILGPTDCSGGLLPCARKGGGSGITTLDSGPQFNITIRNGTIQGMGRSGVYLRGDSHLIERMHIRSNGSGGIWITPSADLGNSIVQHNTVQRNGYAGIETGGGIIAHNVVDVNWFGIRVFYGSALVSHNVVTRNASMSISLGAGGYAGNVITGNGGYPQYSWGNPPLGGTNLGQNVCDGAPCP